MGCGDLAYSGRHARATSHVGRLSTSNVSARTSGIEVIRVKRYPLISRLSLDPRDQITRAVKDVDDERLDLASLVHSPTGSQTTARDADSTPQHGRVVVGDLESPVARGTSLKTLKAPGLTETAEPQGQTNDALLVGA